MASTLAAVPPAPGPLEIRWFRVADRAACQRIAAEAAMSSYGLQMPRLGHVFRETTPLDFAEIRLVASLGGEPAGFIELVGGHVSNLFVDPRRQGRGIGTALLKAAEDWVLGDLTLSVFTLNPGARRLYERLGYAVEALVQTPFHGAVAEVWRMRKRRGLAAERRRYDLVILDVDGTPARSRDLAAASLKALAKQAELEAAPAALARRAGACERSREGSCPIIGALSPEAANA